GFGPGELEEVRRGDEAPTDWKAPPLRTEIDDRCALRSSRWETPPQLGELVRAVFQPPDHRTFVGRPDVLAWLQVRRGLRPAHGNAGLAKRREIIAVCDVVPEIVAHARKPRSPDNLLNLDEHSIPRRMSCQRWCADA